MLHPKEYSPIPFSPQGKEENTVTTWPAQPSGNTARVFRVQEDRPINAEKRAPKRKK